MFLQTLNSDSFLSYEYMNILVTLMLTYQLLTLELSSSMHIWHNYVSM
jgi:hypothetical protein